MTDSELEDIIAGMDMLCIPETYVSAIEVTFGDGMVAIMSMETYERYFGNDDEDSVEDWDRPEQYYHYETDDDEDSVIQPATVARIRIKMDLKKVHADIETVTREILEGISN